MTRKERTQVIIDRGDITELLRLSEGYPCACMGEVDGRRRGHRWRHKHHFTHVHFYKAAAVCRPWPIYISALRGSHDPHR